MKWLPSQIITPSPTFSFFFIPNMTRPLIRGSHRTKVNLISLNFSAPVGRRKLPEPYFWCGLTGKSLIHRQNTLRKFTTAQILWYLEFLKNDKILGFNSYFNIHSPGKYSPARSL